MKVAEAVAKAEDAQNALSVVESAVFMLGTWLLRLRRLKMYRIRFLMRVSASLLVLAHHTPWSRWCDGAHNHTVHVQKKNHSHTHTQIKNQNQKPRTKPKIYVGDVDCRV